MNELILEILTGERWYGLSSDLGIEFPLRAGKDFFCDLRINTTSNQVNPILISNQGRFIWCDEGFKLTVAGNLMTLEADKAPFILEEGFRNLKQAFLEAARKYFPSTGTIPPVQFFKAPQYNTWIELMYDQNQEDVQNYARDILAHGYPAGILMIDDGWSESYGNWTFHSGRFPNPGDMVQTLHKMGFEVMLWTCPFITPDTEQFRYLKSIDCLVKNQDGTTAIREWWNGYSAVLDMTNPKAEVWYTIQNKKLMELYGIDGFKFDAGDGKFYKDSDLFYEKSNANKQNELWALQGLNYPYNEYRSCFKAAGQPLVQRLSDKQHSWGNTGMGALLPNQLAQGIAGYAYTCPDMIGGGEYMSFLDHALNLDSELFVRYAQCAALMPMIQFSAAPWRVLSAEYDTICRNMAFLHQRFSEEITTLAEQAAITGEPITRYMEYEFPNQGMEDVTGQFMLGSRILVAPVCEKGQVKKRVTLPYGEWEFCDGSLWKGKKTIEIDAPLQILPYFLKRDNLP